tara:strand:+ start:716 stop:1201 length:486 start_codon:yes stop_codon:yes gene_type:complete
MFTYFSMDAKEKVKTETNKEKIEKKVLENEDQPEYQEKIMFLVSTTAQGAILFWCICVLSLGYIKLPTSMFGVEIPDQPRIDSTFAAGLLGNILAGWGISVGSNNGNKKKKKEEEGGGVPSGPGVQTIVIKQPLEIITRKPDVLRVDPITGKDIKNDGSLG